MVSTPLKDFSEELQYIYICTRETLRLIYESLHRNPCEDHPTKRAGS
jgi:hypothetical protein